MILLTEIKHHASAFEVSAETTKKDYMISWILNCLAQSLI
jgi:hypothetical protein